MLPKRYCGLSQSMSWAFRIETTSVSGKPCGFSAQLRSHAILSSSLQPWFRTGSECLRWAQTEANGQGLGCNRVEQALSHQKNRFAIFQSLSADLDSAGARSPPGFGQHFFGVWLQLDNPHGTLALRLAWQGNGSRRGGGEICWFCWDRTLGRLKVAILG